MYCFSYIEIYWYYLVIIYSLYIYVCKLICIIYFFYINVYVFIIIIYLFTSSFGICM